VKYDKALPGADTPDLKAAALDMLLTRATQMGDRGASTQVITDTLNRVPMGRAQGMTDAWKSYMDSTAATDAAYRAALARAGGGGGGGRRGIGSVVPPPPPATAPAPITLAAPARPVSFPGVQSAGQRVIAATRRRTPPRGGTGPVRSYLS
jgi:hypothetical protein